MSNISHICYYCTLTAPTKVASAAATKVTSDPARKVAPAAALFLNLNFWWEKPKQILFYQIFLSNLNV
jgi:hypothetical protein